MIYEDFAVRYANKFRMFSAAVTGVTALARAAGKAPGPSEGARVKELKTVFVSEARADLERMNQELLGQSHDFFESRGKERVKSTLAALESVAAQVARKSVREAMLGAANSIDAIIGRSGAIGLVAQNMMADPLTKARDASGRVWVAYRLVKVIARDFAYQTLIDSRFDEALSAGATYATVTHPTPGHEKAGQVIDLTEDWIGYRESIFHPNSNLGVEYGVI